MATKITNKKRYEEIINLVKTHGLTIAVGEGSDMVTENTDDIVAWLNDRIDKLERKSTSSSSKKNEVHELIMSQIMEVLKGGRMKCSEVTTAVNAKFNTEYTSNNINSMLKKLKDNEEVVRVVDKKDVFFEIAPISAE